MPILSGSNHDEERLFVAAGQGLAVSGGTFVKLTPPEITAENYLQQIKATLGVTDDDDALAITGEYPLSAFPSPTVAFSTLVADTNIACTAQKVDRWTSRRVPTYAYEFNDDSVAPRFAPLVPPVATHLSELTYLFHLPNAPIQGPLNADQEALAASMCAAWTNFAADRDPSQAGSRWPTLDHSARTMSFESSQPQLETDFAEQHHCTFWADR